MLQINQAQLKKSKTRLLADFLCADSNTTLELFERVVKDHDLLKEWNKEIREFLQQERKQPTIKVTY